MQDLLRNVIAIVSGYILAYLFAPLVGDLYAYIFPESVTGTIPDAAAAVLIGLPTAVFIFIPLILGLRGGRYQYWLVFLTLLPGILFYLLFDLAHIYFPIVLTAVSLSLGVIGNRLYKKL